MASPKVEACSGGQVADPAIDEPVMEGCGRDKTSEESHGKVSSNVQSEDVTKRESEDELRREVSTVLGPKNTNNESMPRSEGSFEQQKSENTHDLKDVPSGEGNLQETESPGADLQHEETHESALLSIRAANIEIESIVSHPTILQVEEELHQTMTTSEPVSEQQEEPVGGERSQSVLVAIADSSPVLVILQGEEEQPQSANTKNLVSEGTEELGGERRQSEIVLLEDSLPVPVILKSTAPRRSTIWLDRILIFLWFLCCLVLVAACVKLAQHLDWSIMAIITAVPILDHPEGILKYLERPLTLSQAKGIDFAASAVGGPMIIAYANYIWFRIGRRLSSPEIEDLKDPDADSSLETFDAGTYDVGKLTGVLRRWTARNILFSILLVCSALASTLLCNALAYKAIPGSDDEPKGEEEMFYQMVYIPALLYFALCSATAASVAAFLLMFRGRRAIEKRKKILAAIAAGVAVEEYDALIASQRINRRSRFAVSLPDIPGITIPTWRLRRSKTTDFDSSGPRETDPLLPVSERAERASVGKSVIFPSRRFFSFLNYTKSKASAPVDVSETRDVLETQTSDIYIPAQQIPAQKGTPWKFRLWRFSFPALSSKASTSSPREAALSDSYQIDEEAIMVAESSTRSEEFVASDVMVTETTPLLDVARSMDNPNQEQSSKSRSWTFGWFGLPSFNWRQHSDLGFPRIDHSHKGKAVLISGPDVESNFTSREPVDGEAMIAELSQISGDFLTQEFAITESSPLLGVLNNRDISSKDKSLPKSWGFGRVGLPSFDWGHHGDTEYSRIDHSHKGKATVTLQSDVGSKDTSRVPPNGEGTEANSSQTSGNFLTRETIITETSPLISVSNDSDISPQYPPRSKGWGYGRVGFPSLGWKQHVKPEPSDVGYSHTGKVATILRSDIEPLPTAQEPPNREIVRIAESSRKSEDLDVQETMLMESTPLLEVSNDEQILPKNPPHSKTWTFGYFGLPSFARDSNTIGAQRGTSIDVPRFDIESPGILRESPLDEIAMAISTESSPLVNVSEPVASSHRPVHEYSKAPNFKWPGLPSLGLGKRVKPEILPVYQNQTDTIESTHSEMMSTSVHAVSSGTSPQKEPRNSAYWNVPQFHMPQLSLNSNKYSAEDLESQVTPHFGNGKGKGKGTEQVISENVAINSNSRQTSSWGLPHFQMPKFSTRHAQKDMTIHRSEQLVVNSTPRFEQTHGEDTTEKPKSSKDAHNDVASTASPIVANHTPGLTQSYKFDTALPSLGSGWTNQQGIEWTSESVARNLAEHITIHTEIQPLRQTYEVDTHAVIIEEKPESQSNPTVSKSSTNPKISTSSNSRGWAFGGMDLPSLNGKWSYEGQSSEKLKNGKGKNVSTPGDSAIVKPTLEQARPGPALVTSQKSKKSYSWGLPHIERPEGPNFSSGGKRKGPATERALDDVSAPNEQIVLNPAPEGTEKSKSGYSWGLPRAGLPTISGFSSNGTSNTLSTAHTVMTPTKQTHSNPGPVVSEQSRRSYSWSLPQMNLAPVSRFPSTGKGKERHTNQRVTSFGGSSPALASPPIQSETNAIGDFSKSTHSKEIITKMQSDRSAMTKEPGSGEGWNKRNLSWRQGDTSNSPEGSVQSKKAIMTTKPSSPTSSSKQVLSPQPTTSSPIPSTSLQHSHGDHHHHHHHHHSHGHHHHHSQKPGTRASTSGNEAVRSDTSSQVTIKHSTPLKQLPSTASASPTVEHSRQKSWNSWGWSHYKNDTASTSNSTQSAIHQHSQKPETKATSSKSTQSAIHQHSRKPEVKATASNATQSAIHQHSQNPEIKATTSRSEVSRTDINAQRTAKHSTPFKSLSPTASVSTTVERSRQKSWNSWGWSHYKNDAVSASNSTQSAIHQHSQNPETQVIASNSRQNEIRQYSQTPETKVTASRSEASHNDTNSQGTPQYNTSPKKLSVPASASATAETSQQQSWNESEWPHSKDDTASAQIDNSPLDLEAGRTASSVQMSEVRKGASWGFSSLRGVKKDVRSNWDFGEWEAPVKKVVKPSWDFGEWGDLN